MQSFTNDDYISMKENSKVIFKDNIHQNKVKELMKEEWGNIRNFPYQDYNKIKEWQLKRISYM